MRNASKWFVVLNIALVGALAGCDGAFDTTSRLDDTRNIAAPGSATALAQPAAGQPYGAAQPSYDAGQPTGSAQPSAPALDPSAFSHSYSPPPAADAPAAGTDSRSDAQQPADPFAKTPPSGTGLKPAIAYVSPSSGRGGEQVVIAGNDFSNVQVLFGGEAAQITGQSSNAVTVVAPAGQHGPVTVVVTNRDGSYSVAGGAYVYQ